jgi:hypothetical protein
MRYIKSFEIDSLGVEWPDYFQGYGAGEYDRSVTGIGNNAAEAYDDALEQIASEGTNVDDMPKRPAGIRKSDSVPPGHGEESPYYYVGIRYNVTGEIDPAEDDGKQYSIVRYYNPGNGRKIRKPQTIQTCLTIGQARAHCNDPKTSTAKYFDGYVRQ